MKGLAAFAFVISALITIAPAKGLSQDHGSEFYVGGSFGALLDVDAAGENDTIFAIIGNIVQQDFEPDGEFRVSVLVGTRIKEQFRVEAELSYASSDVDTVTFGTTRTTASGDITAATFMVNGWYEFSTAVGIRPYFGGGLGYAVVDASVNGTGAVTTFDDSDFGFAYQLGFGVTFPVGPSGFVDMGYRFREVPNLVLTSESINSDAFRGIDYQTHTLQIGYSFVF